MTINVRCNDNDVRQRCNDDETMGTVRPLDEFDIADTADPAP